MKVLVASPEAKDKVSRERRGLMVRALEDLKVNLINPLPGRPPKKLRLPTLFPYLTYEKESQLLLKADLLVADLTQTDFKTGFLVSQALTGGKPVLGLFWRKIASKEVEDWSKNDLFYIDSFDKENILFVLRRFFKFVQQQRRHRGKLIVIDGTDGSGKATQCQLLLDYLKKVGYRTKYIDFPRYYSSFHGGMVGRYLKGEFGGLDEVNPYLASLTYALDRLTAKEDMDTWLRNGNLVVTNRYTSSNMAFQTVRVKPEERENF
jgi:nucleoside 2-deoxyribosyltransferase